MLKLKLIKERLVEQCLLGGRAIVFVFLEPGLFRPKQRILKGTLKVVLSHQELPLEVAQDELAKQIRDEEGRVTDPNYEDGRLTDISDHEGRDKNKCKTDKNKN